MKVSALMPTYDRGDRMEVVEEAIESFLRQDYDERELIVCNDCPSQKLIFDHELVKIFNVNERFKTLSDKIEFMLSAADGEAFCRWDDDDICAPHRLSMSVEKLGNGMEWKPANYWCSLNSRAEDLKLQELLFSGNCHIMALWTREALDAIGGYPSALSGIEDQAFNKALERAGISRVLEAEILPLDQIFYLYRWGTGTVHLSGKSSGDQSNPHQAHWDEIGSRIPSRSGDIELVPHWSRDYVAEMAAATERLR